MPEHLFVFCFLFLFYRGASPFVCFTAPNPSNVKHLSCIPSGAQKTPTRRKRLVPSRPNRSPRWKTAITRSRRGVVRVRRPSGLVTRSLGRITTCRADSDGWKLGLDYYNTIIIITIMLLLLSLLRLRFKYYLALCYRYQE